MAAHSRFSASAAHRWSPCAGSLVLAADFEDKTSIHAATGTVAHSVLEISMANGVAPARLLGTVMEQDGFSITVDQDMVDAVQTAIDNIREIIAGHDMVLTETRVNYAEHLEVEHEQAFGTADLIAIVGDELQVHDYKHGVGVPVSAVGNLQMILYAAGALSEYGDIADIARVRMVIHQPRVRQAPSEWSIELAELHEHLAALRESAKRCQQAKAAPVDHGWYKTWLTPGESQCRWCPAKAMCPALRDEVASVIFSSVPASPDEFADAVVIPVDAAADLPDRSRWLASCMSRVDLIEDWCRSVRSEVERQLLRGDAVPGFKLVAGRKGPRAWSSQDQVEDYLRKTVRMPIEKMYEQKLISPAVAEKTIKSELGERQWSKLCEFMVQSSGKPSVAAASDSRPAIASVAAASDSRPAIDIAPTAADFDVV